MCTSQVLWQPSEQRVRGSQMHEFLTRIASRYGIDASWEALRRWAIDSRDEFWAEMLEYAEIEPAAPFVSVTSGEDIIATKWFEGLRLNYARHLLRFDDDEPAILFESESGQERSLTHHQLRDAVARCAEGLRRADIRQGDRVAGFMPNLPETIIAMLAAASLGAIWSSCSPDFGVAGVLDRFGQIQPTVLITADGYTYRGQRYDSLQRVADMIEQLPSVRRVVVVPYVEDEPDLSAVKSAVSWRDFLGPADQPAPKLRFEELPFDHPLFVMFSSGTMGMPKCIVHGAGGTLLQHMKELMLHCDLHGGERILYFTTCGWMMWNWLVSALGIGAAVVLFEGSPTFPGAGRLWKTVERLRVNVFGTSPTYLGACQKAGVKPGSEYDLSPLRCMLSTGSPLTEEQFRWVYDEVKRDLQLSSISGGTDIISCFMLGNPILPVRAGEIQCLGLGMDVQAFDEQGRPVIGKKGELVCCSPFPSRPVGFWNDPHGAKYRAAYFDHFPGIWRHGDYIEIAPSGGVIVHGRSDATLNPGGVRIGTAEIYRPVEALPEVVDSIVVGKQTNGDVEVVLFVVLREGLTLTKELTKRIREAIAAMATPRHVPKHIHQVSDIPRTISGKKVELAVTQMLHGEPVLNRDALANPDALEQFRDAL
jgi:acetoacetyl-CoA synthetase